MKRRARRAAAACGLLVASYVLLLFYPHPLFAHELEQSGIVLHATRPIPDVMRDTLSRVRARVDRSGLVGPADRFHVFICDSPWLFALFARNNYRVGGIANVYLGGHVFLRQSDLEHDRLISPSGKPVPDDRPLSYFMAHEIMHVVHGRRLGIVGYTRLPRWVDDGHADFVARDIDLAAALEGLKRGDAALDPARSGLYVRYHLMVAHELSKPGASAAALLERPRAAEEIERELMAISP